MSRQHQVLPTAQDWSYVSGLPTTTHNIVWGSEGSLALELSGLSFPTFMLPSPALCLLSETDSG